MMNSLVSQDEVNLRVAQRWCEQRGCDWELIDTAGRGGTAPVFTVHGPRGHLALKIYDERFSSGDKGALEAVRVGQQVMLGQHGCPHLIETHDGGRFEDRLFLLMNKAPGKELEKVLDKIPRDKIRRIVSQIAKACEFLREKKLCHRDIKSANIFITDDFDNATLLDLSVLRDIYDPVGIGTDHDNQLPVVATARYSPPEYLFRLEEPTAEFWHGLDIYQLGGLLHDLIMRKPLFEDEYQVAKENRYRFAWLVATKEPLLDASDVDQSIIALARRALDKEWHRRRLLTLADFAESQEVVQAQAATLFGFSSNVGAPTNDQHYDLSQMQYVAQQVKSSLIDHLRNVGIVAIHETVSSELGRVQTITLKWSLKSNGPDLLAENVILKVILSHKFKRDREFVAIKVMLFGVISGSEHTSELSLPEVELLENSSSAVTKAVISSLASVSASAVAIQA